jgi:hypothetical protein
MATEVQDRFSAKLSRKDRRALRMPQELRETYRRIAATENEEDRQQERWTARQQRHQWLTEMRRVRVMATIAEGRVLGRSKKLHRIVTVTDGPPNEIQDTSVAAAWLQQTYMSKWGCEQHDERIAIYDFVLQHEDQSTPLTPHELDAVFGFLPTQDKCDSHEISLKLLRLWLSAAPVSAVEFFNHIMSSTPAASQWEVCCHIFGKYASQTAASDTRAILPLPSGLSIVDAALSIRWNAWIDAHLPQPHGVHVGARPASQSLNIAHA